MPWLLFLIGLLASLPIMAEPLIFTIADDEGGKFRKGSINRFEHYMREQDCELKVIAIEKSALFLNSDLAFSAMPDKAIQQDKPFQKYESRQKYESLEKFQPINSAIVLNNESMTLAIMIKKSTGIENLASLQGERLGLVSHTSFIGGITAKDLLADSGITPQEDDIYQTGSYLGAMSMLLHGDVFFAAIPGPLARQWQEHNKLRIIAESEAYELGTLYIKHSISKALKASCQNAFNSLQRTRKHNKMILFPSWITGFQSTQLK